MTIKNPEEENTADQTQDSAIASEVSRPEGEVDTPATKKDDFFDMDPGKETETEQKPAENDVQESKAGETTETEGREAEAAVVENGEAEAEPAAEAESPNADDGAPAAEEKEEAANTTSEQEPEPQSAANPAPETAEEPAAADGAAAEPEERQDGNGEEQPAPAVSAAEDTPAEPEPAAEAAPEQATEAEPSPADTPAQEETQELSVPEADRVPSREEEYDEDFSEMSEKSDKGGAAGAAVVVQDASAEEGRSSMSKSPTPSSKDEPRAEAGAVVRVPAPVVQSDGRSREGEGMESRGEDRSEVQGDGGDNTRGTGQWKSEEESYMESTLMKQHAEQEALQLVIDEKTKLQREYDELQVRYMALEADSKKWEEEINMLKEKCQRQEARIKELEAEEARLREYESWGKDNEAKVKDLQSRLAILAGEDAEKDRRIQKLEEDLRDTNSRLINAERQAALGAQALNQETPKSKTCVVM